METLSHTYLVGVRANAMTGQCRGGTEDGLRAMLGRWSQHPLTRARVAGAQSGCGSDGFDNSRPAGVSGGSWLGTRDWVFHVPPDHNRVGTTRDAD